MGRRRRKFPIPPEYYNCGWITKLKEGTDYTVKYKKPYKSNIGNTIRDIVVTIKDPRFKKVKFMLRTERSYSGLE